MKKLFYASIAVFFLLAFNATRSGAQYTITGNSIYHNCTGESYLVVTSAIGSVPGMTLQTYFGDGSNTVSLADSSPIYIYHSYLLSGVYTVKHVLIYSGVRMDSVTLSDTANVCHFVPLIPYLDNNTNCVDDLGDNNIVSPYTVKIDSAGVPVDTITATSIYYITPAGTPTGTVYSFTVLTPPTGTVVSCPLSGVVTYTVGVSTGSLYVGLNCSSTTGFDIGESVTVGGPGRHMSNVDIIVSNAYCTAHSGTLTLTFSPKYNFSYGTPTPTSVVGNVLTYNIPAISSLAPVMIHAHFDVPSTWLIPGDTIQSSYVLTPTTGDLDPSNNTVIRVDTVKSSYDPNEKSVTPEGVIAPGTTLKYTIQFENTGNAPAANIHIMDTLSGNLDPKTFKLVNASANVFTTIDHVGGLYILKFDFPNINLPDSAHGQNDGTVTFTMKAKMGLSAGTVIPNHAGIYFDDNDVVITNTVQNVIGSPTQTAVMSNKPQVAVYPNPVTDILTVNTDAGLYNFISITNMVGQSMISVPVTTPSTRVNVQQLPAGIYYLALKGAHGVKVEKFEKL